MTGNKDFDLRGKDWLTEAEAAHYCGVSLSHFQHNSSAFTPKRHLGKKLYSRAVLYAAIEASPLWYGQPSADRMYVRPTRTEAEEKLWLRLRNQRLRPYKPRKKPDPNSTVT